MTTRRETLYLSASGRREAAQESRSSHSPVYTKEISLSTASGSESRISTRPDWVSLVSLCENMALKTSDLAERTSVWQGKVFSPHTRSTSDRSPLERSSPKLWERESPPSREARSRERLALAASCGQSQTISYQQPMVSFPSGRRTAALRVISSLEKPFSSPQSGFRSVKVLL